MPDFASFYRSQSWVLRGVFLALIGPVIGTCVIVLIIPLLALGFFMGWKIWIFIFLIGLFPSAAVATTTLAFQVRKIGRYKNFIATTLAGAICTAIWSAALKYGAGDHNLFY